MQQRAQLFYLPGNNEPSTIDHARVPGVGRRMACICGPAKDGVYPVYIRAHQEFVHGTCRQEERGDWIFTKADDQLAAALQTLPHFLRSNERSMALRDRNE